MNVKEVKQKFARIDADVSDDIPFDGFNKRFVDGISRVISGDKE